MKVPTPGENARPLAAPTVTVLFFSALALAKLSVPAVIVVPPVKVLFPARTWVPDPFITSPIVPSVPPPAITPLKTVEPPVG